MPTLDRRAFLLASPVIVLSLLAVLSELLLPGFAERRLRSSLDDYGSVEHVSVDAFPAVTLLWGKADEVTVRMREARAAAGGDLAELIDRTRDAGSVESSARVLRVGPLVMRDARMSKRDDGSLVSSARMTDRELTESVPGNFSVRGVSVADDGSLIFEVAAGAFGIEVSGRARVSARDGAVVIAPEDFGGLVGSLATLTVFRDRRVRVERIGARDRPDGFEVTARGRLP